MEWHPLDGIDHDGYLVGSNGVVIGQRGTALTPFLAGKYLAVKLRRGGRYRNHYVHHLVARVFLGARPPGLQVAHNDGDRFNNAAANLRYATAKENGQDRVKHGRHLRPTCRVSAETERRVIHVRRSLPDASVATVARLSGVSQDTVGRVMRRST